MCIKAFCGVSVYNFHAGITALHRARESVARRKMLQSSTVLNFHALRQRTQAIQPIIYRCHELSLQRIDLAITSESSHWTISSWRRNRKRWVYTFDAVKRFDTLSYASQMRIKAFCGVSVYTFHAGISARQRARESVARRKMLQSSTVLNFHALRQRTQAVQPIIYRCHELSLQRIDLAITSESSHWTISSWRRSRKAHLIAVKVQSWPCWSNWGFRSCLAPPDIQFNLFL